MPRRRLIALLVTALATIGVSSAAEPSLKELGAKRQILVGTAVKPVPIAQESKYRDTLLRHFNIITPENEMKLKRICPQPGRWDFSEADSIVAFAQKNGLLVRGHTLVWNADQHSPEWLLNQPTEPQVATRLMAEYIIKLMTRYRGHVREWDVVNEAISNDNRPEASPYVDGYWLKALGPDYIATAFRIARQADPTARLFYNDYDHGQALGPKSDRIYNLLKKLRADGVPVDGVGLQMHCNIEKPPKKADMIANFRRLSALGLRVAVTELDVEIMTASGPLEQRLERQAKVYRDVTEAVLESGCVESLVMWGFTDKFRQAGLLARKGLGEQDTPMWIFDAKYRPKPAFHAVAKALADSQTSKR